MWHAYNLAKACFCRPSDLYGLTENDWVAYCFDDAVIEFGTRLDAALEEAGDGAKTVAEGKRKQQAILARWLMKDDPHQFAKQFADPVATKRSK